MIETFHHEHDGLVIDLRRDTFELHVTFPQGLTASELCALVDDLPELPEWANDKEDEITVFINQLV